MHIPKLAAAMSVMFLGTFTTAPFAAVPSGGEMLLPDNTWNLFAPGLTANGKFIPGNNPAAIVEGGLFPGQSVNTSWTSGSVDGWGGTMIFHGVPYNLTSSDFASAQSIMSMNSSGFTVDHAGEYSGGFSFSASFCGWISEPNTGPCYTTVSLVGSGSVDMVVVPVDASGSFFSIASLSYGFSDLTAVPEPASLGLLAMGLTLMACVRYLRVRTPVASSV